MLPGRFVLPGGAVQQPHHRLAAIQPGGTDAPNTRNKILFENVFIPAGTVTTIRISNIRIACEESPATVANGLTQIYEQVSSNNVTFSGQNSVPVATVLVPMQFKATGCNGSGSANTSFQQCVGRNVPVSAMSSTFNVQFIEGFALAFKPRTSTISQPRWQPVPVRERILLHLSDLAGRQHRGGRGSREHGHQP